MKVLSADCGAGVCAGDETHESHAATVIQNSAEKRAAMPTCFHSRAGFPNDFGSNQIDHTSGNKATLS